MSKVVVELYYVRASVSGGAYGWGPFQSEADAERARQMLVSSHLPGGVGVPFVDKETHEMEDTHAASIVYHDGKFKGRGRAVV